jgi:hypothetical protein
MILIFTNVQTVPNVCVESMNRIECWVIDTVEKDGLLCNGVVNSADNTWFSTQRKTEEEPNPILRSLKLYFSLLFGIGVCLVAEQANSARKTARKFYRLIRYVSSYHIKSTTRTIGGPGCTAECDEFYIFKRKYNRGRLYVLEDWWMFDVICRETGECFAMVVLDRTKNTLWPFMASRIAAEFLH